MFCTKCGKELGGNQKFCTNCGNPFKSTRNNFSKTQPYSQGIKFSELRRYIPALVLLGIIGWGMYASLDDDAVNTNNQAMTAYDSGDSSQAIPQFEQAYEQATTNETKITTLVNLAYAYQAEGETDKSIEAFKKALTFTSNNSYDYYLISGEIADLENKPNSAYLAFTKANEINPEGFQANNALALLYLDLYDTAPQYLDYKKALFYAQKAYNLNDSQIAKENLALAHYFNENYTQTISLLSSINISNKPMYAYFLGLAYAQTDQVSNAKYYLKQAIAGGMEVPQEVYDYLYNN